MLRMLLWLLVLSLVVPTVAQEGDMSAEMDAYLDRLSEWGYMGFGFDCPRRGCGIAARVWYCGYPHRYPN